MKQQIMNCLSLLLVILLVFIHLAKAYDHNDIIYGPKCIQCVGYLNLTAEEKMKRIWYFIESSKLTKPYKADYPSQLEEMILLVQNLDAVFDQWNDVLPAKRNKMVHSIGSAAKIKYISHIAGKDKYTGIYNAGSAYGLMRLSLALNPKTSGNFAPGFGLKFLVDGQYSQNLIGMYEAKGNGLNYDFFAVQLKTKVGGEPKIGFVDSLLLKAFQKAEFPSDILGVDAPSIFEENGKENLEPKHPVMLYFVPTQAMKEKRFDYSEHDFRLDLDTIEPGTDIYDVYGTDVQCLCGANPCKDILSNLEHCKAEKIGTIQSVTKFVASEFGDKSLFFQHSRWVKKDRNTCTYKYPLDALNRDSTVMPNDPNSDCQSASECSSKFGNELVSSSRGCPFDKYLKTADTEFNVFSMVVQQTSNHCDSTLVFVLVVVGVVYLYMKQTRMQSEILRNAKMNSEKSIYEPLREC